MKTKKIILSFVFLFVCLFVFVSCDAVKQIISDTAAPIIEEKVNEIIGLSDAAEEDKFTLPDALRYENFVVETESNPERYGLDVIEPHVTFEEYAVMLNERLGGTFTKEELLEGYEEVKAAENWQYVDEYGTTYDLVFIEETDSAGNILKWSVSLEITYTE